MMNSTSWLGFSNKSLRFLFTMAMVTFWTACADDSKYIAPDNDAASAKPQGGHTIIGSIDQDNLITITVKNFNADGKAQAASHLLLQFLDCDGNYINNDNLLLGYLTPGFEPSWSTGVGTGCAPDNSGSFLKIENLPSGSEFSFTLKFNVPIASGSVIVKAGRSSCVSYSVLDVNGANPFTCADDEEETGFAKGETASCFGSNRWGWTNYLEAEGEYTMPVYAGAGQCDITKGTLVGTVTINYSGGTVTAAWNIDSQHVLGTTHLYAGYTLLPQSCNSKGCKNTLAPGQYTVGTNLSGSIYVVAHANVVVN